MGSVIASDHTVPAAEVLTVAHQIVCAEARALYRRGGRLVCSSDAGVTPTKPHHVLPFGVSEFLPSIGMSSAEAIANVTRLAAEACGIESMTGTLEPGKDADIVVVAGNPLADIQAIHRVLAVFTRGEQVTMSTTTTGRLQD